MARTGISYLDVAKAATQLKEQGFNPTVAEVRKALNNTGSNSTINRHLREWETKQGNRIEAEKGIPSTLLSVVKGLYDAIGEDAHQKIVSAKQLDQEKLTGIEARLNEANKDNKTLRDSNHQLTKENASLNEQMQLLQLKQQELQNNLVQQQSENQSLTARLDDKNKEIERIAKQIRHAQENLEHYRETTRQQREEEKRTYETKVGKLELKQDENTKTISELNCLLAEKNKEIEQLNNTHNTLQGNHDILQKQKATHDELMQKTQISLETMKHAYQQLENNYKEKVLLLDNLMRQSDELKTQIATLQEKVESYQNNLIKAEDKINQLQDERLFIAQEKSELAKQIELMNL